MQLARAGDAGADSVVHAVGLTFAATRMVRTSIRRIGRVSTACAASLFTFVVLLALAEVAQAQFTFATNNGTITIAGYTGSGGAVTIPSTVDGLPVTSIGERAFLGCAATNVTIPDSVASIGDMAFYDCQLLISASIPDSVTTIGDGAFCYCYRLVSADIPGRATKIGEGAFYGCGLTNLTIPGSVTRIEFRAFSGMNSLASVIIPNGVAYIGQEAFSFCPALSNVIIPTSVTNIEMEAFWGCTGLATIAIPDSVTRIGNGAFLNCINLAIVALPTSLTTIDGLTFYQCAGLKSVTVPKGVTKIWDRAFYGCTSLAGVYFLGNPPDLGLDVFDNDSDATFYYLPSATGWGPSFGGIPTALLLPLTIQRSPLTQTAEAGSTVDLRVLVNGPVQFCSWYLNDTNIVNFVSRCDLEHFPVQFSRSGVYTAVITNVTGAVTSSPAMLQVVAPLPRQLLPSLRMTGEPASLVNVDYTDAISPAASWAPLGSISLTNAPNYYFDFNVLPLAQHRFYRARQTGAPSVVPSLDLRKVPAITLTGNISDKLRVDYINQFGPIDAWVTLDTVTLTNTSQVYFDTTAVGQPPRLWRLVPEP
jgi:hypothetical protein